MVESSSKESVIFYHDPVTIHQKYLVDESINRQQNRKTATGRYEGEGFALESKLRE
jgi:hypothetical protein